MKTKTSAIILLLLAFLVSAWGNVIAASFCPTYLARNVSIKHPYQPTKGVEGSCHFEMADIDMGDMQMDTGEEPASHSEDMSLAEVQSSGGATESPIEPRLLEARTEPCSHCWMHSQASSGSAMAAAILPPQPPQSNAPVTQTSLDIPFVPSTFVVRKEHGPPGNSSPRYILINVFRI